MNKGRKYAEERKTDSDNERNIEINKKKLSLKSIEDRWAVAVGKEKKRVDQRRSV
jgi:hypothetical protein